MATLSNNMNTGVAADPEHPGIASLLTNKSAALRSRASINITERFNQGRSGQDSGIEAAKADFSAAAEAANRPLR